MRKNQFLPLLALLVAFGAAAFTIPEQAPQPALDTMHFQFIGDAADGDEYRLEENWTAGSPGGSGCSSGSLPCVVEVENAETFGITDLSDFVAYLDAQPDDGEDFVVDNKISERP